MVRLVVLFNGKVSADGEFQFQYGAIGSSVAIMGDWAEGCFNSSMVRLVA